MNQSLDFTSYSNIERLSEEEVVELWNNYFNSNKNKQYRDALILQYIYLVRYVVGRLRSVNMPIPVSFDDLVSYGVEGLIDSIERFANHKGCKFETYAITRIRGCIIDKLRSFDFVPKSIRRKINDIKSAQETLRLQYERKPTKQEIADYLGMEAGKIDQIMTEDIVVTSIYDKKNADDNNIEVIDTIEDTKTLGPAENYEDFDTKAQLEKAIKRIPERERIILVLYYHEDMTFKEIGETLNISESRACQIHAQAIVKLKKQLSETRSNRLMKRIIAK